MTIDTHSHLLPGVDHGCPDLATSLQMARAAWAVGTTTVVCTPHLLDWDPALVSEARAALAQLRTALQSEGIPLRLLLGFEVDASVIADVDEAMLAALAISDPEDGDDVAAVQRRPILVEAPFFGWPPFMEESLFRISVAGYVPILAHPERNERIQRSPELLRACIRAGAIAQGTAGSMSGQFRRGSMRTFLDLLARGDLQLLASDAHCQVDYTWSLQPLKDELSKRLTPEQLHLLTHVNPERVLGGESPLPLNGPVPRGGGRPWWR